MTTIDKSKPVLVTGATGYVAGWLVKMLLDEGITVHAAVRNPDIKEKVQHLIDMAEAAPGEIKFFKSDLLEDGSYAEAMKDCELVYHTASPFKTAVDDPEEELIEPAKQGTRNVLEQAHKTESVKRVVVTSSCAAIYGDNADLKDTPNGVFTEEDWNTSSSLEHQPYPYSKTLAEKEAWKINETQDRWDLVVINPSLVLGPALNPNAVTSESFAILKMFGDGQLKPGMPKLGIGIVDVREVAFAHYRAGFLPEAKGRNIVSGHNTGFHEMAEILRSKYGEDYPIPKRVLPKFLVWLFGPMINKTMTRKYVMRNVGLPWKADNTKSKEVLGVEYRSLKETLEESFQQLIDEKILKS